MEYILPQHVKQVGLSEVTDKCMCNDLVIFLPQIKYVVLLCIIVTWLLKHNPISHPTKVTVKIKIHFQNKATGAVHLSLEN